MIQAETQAQGAEGFSSKAPCKEPQSTGTDYRKGHIYKHSKTLLVHENGTKEGWAHKIDTGRDAVMITKIDTVMILASRTVQARGLIS